MKKIMIILFPFFLLIGFTGFQAHLISGIQGSIDPPQGAKRVVAINATDSVVVIPAVGNFSIEVKPGTWRLVVETVAPYKNATLDNIVVNPEQITNVGVIKLEDK
jgi:hypothetical protein